MVLNRWLAASLTLWLAVASCPGNAALSDADLIGIAQTQDLGRHVVWLRLLHYDRRGDRSEVASQEFFLSPRGQSDPRAELEATLNAYFLPWGADADQHPRCRFPARYFWLSQQLPLPHYTLREPRCRRLERWALFDRIRSISVLQVSGYFGNPASTFGHALLKLNTDAPDDELGLFDLSLNFGALIPDDETALRYIIRGLFGGYEAGFSDQYFYTQDLVYARTELRDIWDYRLALPDDARTLLVLHVWEIVGKKFPYYFMTKNCAYRLAELLELATGEAFVEDVRFWYVPVELFHRLIDIDKHRVAAGAPPLVDAVRFIPSSQRAFHHEFSRLSPVETQTANEIILGGTAAISASMVALPEDRQSEVLDAVLSYYQYRTMAEQPTPSDELRAAKDAILRERLRLPPRVDLSPKPPALPPPSHGSRPMLMSVGIASDRQGDQYWRLGWAPFSHDLVGNNNIEGDELVVFDLALGLDNSRAFLERLHLARVRKLNTVPTSVVGESRVSWEFLIGANRVVVEGNERTDSFLSFGAGRAWKWTDASRAYLMVDVAAHTLSPHARVRPHVGIVKGSGQWRTWLQLGAENADGSARSREVWEGKIQYHLSTNRALRVEFGNSTAMRVAASLGWYW